MALNPQYEEIGKGFVTQYYAMFDDPMQRPNLVNLYNVSGGAPPRSGFGWNRGWESCGIRVLLSAVGQVVLTSTFLLFFLLRCWVEQQEGKEEFSALPYLLLSYIRENDVRVTLALNHFSFAHSLFVKLFLANFGRSIS